MKLITVKEDQYSDGSFKKTIINADKIVELTETKASSTHILYIHLKDNIEIGLVGDEEIANFYTRLLERD